MLNNLFFIWVPLIFIIATPVVQVVLSIRAVADKPKLTLFWANAIAVLLGVLLPAAATLVSIAGFPPGLKCATGCFAFVLAGWGIAIVFAPVIAILFGIIWYRKKQKAALS